jgi:hypothetical protein
VDEILVSFNFRFRLQAFTLLLFLFLFGSAFRTPLVREVNLRTGLAPGSWFHTSTSRAVGHRFAATANSSALRKTTLPTGASCSEEKTRT